MSLSTRAYNKLRRIVTRLDLKRKHRLAKGDLFVDYGLMKLLFSNDGDIQEIYYHMNCLNWYRNDMEFFQEYIDKGDIVIDIGANLGFTATIFASLVGANGKVFCFEPSKSIFLKLEKAIAANDLSQVVIPYNLGCGKEETKILLNSVSLSSGNSSIINKNSSMEKSEEIKIVPLDSIDAFWKHQISFIKIDTEGFEPDVLLGAKRIISTYRPVICIEMGGDYLESTKKSLSILDEYRYQTLIPDNIDWSKVGNGVNFISVPR